MPARFFLVPVPTNSPPPPLLFPPLSPLFTAARLANFIAGAPSTCRYPRSNSTLPVSPRPPHLPYLLPHDVALLLMPFVLPHLQQIKCNLDDRSAPLPEAAPAASLPLVWMQSSRTTTSSPSPSSPVPRHALHRHWELL
jgi:hypothetical protein